MANDIYFGSGRKKNAAEADPNTGAQRPAARQPVTRDPEPAAGASFSRRDPAQTGDMTEQMRRMGAAGRQNGQAADRQRVTRDPAQPIRTAAQPVRSAPVRSAAEENMITEQIDSELLHRKPTQMPFNYINTDDEFEDFGNKKALTERQKEKRKNKALKEAQKKAKKAGKKKSGFGRFVRAALCVLLALAVLMAGATAFVMTGYRPEKLAGNAYVSDAELLSHPGVYNLLLMGIDMNDTSASSRSDSMILLSVDNAHMKLKMTSFMRDSYVTIPGHGEAKLNAACTYGGPQLVCDTIEYNFGIRIDGYVKIGYEILTELVDGIGGITIPEVDAVEAAALAAEGYDAPIGVNIKMNGFQALQYCRIRKGQDDFYRTERQREVLNIIIKKTLLTNPVKLALLGRKLIAKTECSVSHPALFALAFRVLPCLIGGNASARIPQDGTWFDDTRGGQAVLVVNFEENTAFLKDFIYGK